MLKLRIITALVLLAILVPAVFYPAYQVFAVVALVLIAAAAWEWARLNQLEQRAALVCSAIAAFLCALTWWAGWVTEHLRMVWLVSGAVWVLFGVWLLAGGVAAWKSLPQWLRLLLGILALWAAWLAVAQARAVGVNYLFSVLVLVWVADISAYFAGRALGGRFVQRKLAPSISPGKTWEGVAGAVLGVLLTAYVWRWVEQMNGSHSASLYTHLALRGLPVFLVGLMFMVAMSIVGDLVESLFKRSAGVKDSSNLLPGHGGVLDRIDALLPTLPLAMMLLTL
jgi:phosphatidate cytidylyltransferase